MSSVLVAEAKRLHSARQNVLFAMDTESYDLKSIRSLPGGFQLNLKADAFSPGRAPHDGPLKVAVPSDFVRLVKPIFAEAVPQSDPANLGSDPVQRAKNAVRALIANYDINGSVVLLDLDRHEEARLRRRHGVPKREGISPLFRRKPALLESMLEERILVDWDPDMTKFAFDHAQAKHFDGAKPSKARLIDDKVYDLSNMTIIPGALEAPVNTKTSVPGSWPAFPIKIVVPSDLAMRLRSLWLTASERYNDIEYPGTRYEYADAAMDKYMAKYVDAGKLLDLPADEESKLRHQYKVASDQNLAPLFQGNPSLLPKAFEQWDPEETVVEMEKLRLVG